MQKQTLLLSTAALLAAAIAAPSLGYAATDLSQGYGVVGEAKADEGKGATAEPKPEGDEKAAEGKCGEGKTEGGEKAAEGKCGEGKCGEGKCGG